MTDCHRLVPAHLLGACPPHASSAAYCSSCALLMADRRKGPDWRGRWHTRITRIARCRDNSAKNPKASPKSRVFPFYFCFPLLSLSLSLALPCMPDLLSCWPFLFTPLNSLLPLLLTPYVTIFRLTGSPKYTSRARSTHASWIVCII